MGDQGESYQYPVGEKLLNPHCRSEGLVKGRIYRSCDSNSRERTPSEMSSRLSRRVETVERVKEGRRS